MSSLKHLLNDDEDELRVDNVKNELNELKPKRVCCTSREENR